MYEKMYHKLAGAVANAMDLLEGHKYQEALLLLEQAGKEVEEIYIAQ